MRNICRCKDTRTLAWEEVKVMAVKYEQLIGLNENEMGNIVSQVAEVKQRLLLKEAYQ